MFVTENNLLLYWRLETGAKEMEEILNDNIYYDNGCDEMRIARKDIPLAIALTPLNWRSKIFCLENGRTKEICTTCGNFIDRANQDWLKENQSEVIKFQQSEEELTVGFCFEDF